MTAGKEGGRAGRREGGRELAHGRSRARRGGCGLAGRALWVSESREQPLKG